MARSKKVLKEIEIDSDSDIEQMEKPIKKTKITPPKEEDDEETVQRPPIIKKELSDKKIEALRLANEARLRRKIEREFAEKQEAQKNEERMLEQKVLELLGKHLPKKRSKKRALTPISESEDEQEESDSETSRPKRKTYQKGKAKKQPAQEDYYESEDEYAPPTYHHYVQQESVNAAVANPLFNKIFG